MYQLKINALRSGYGQEVVRALSASPYLGKSPLGPEFVDTRGFSLMFRRTGLPDVVEHFPFLREFLEAVLFPQSNAFYVNPLVMSKGSRVGAHVDCRLVVSRDVRIIPTVVSIYYAQADSRVQGGEITLNIGKDPEVSVYPESNSILHFKGDVIHSVSELRKCDKAWPRVCLVCEQYNLEEATLDAFPGFQIILDADVSPRVAAVSA